MQFRPLIVQKGMLKLHGLKMHFCNLSCPDQAKQATPGQAGQTRAYYQAVFLLSAILIDWYSALLYYYLLNLSSLKDPPGWSLLSCKFSWSCRFVSSATVAAAAAIAATTVAAAIPADKLKTKKWFKMIANLMKNLG